MSVKIASEWLNACSGCEISILDMGERLLDILQKVEIVHMPALMDHKYYGQKGDRTELEIPEAEAGIISGGIRNDEHLEVAREMRKKCKLIVAIGTCATHGGIPALANSYGTQSVLQRYYSTESTDPGQPLPGEGLPELMDACYALDEKIGVDLYFPGCPPHSDHVFAALAALAEGGLPSLPGKSVCDTCPTIRQGKGRIKQVRRFLQAPHYASPEEPLDRMHCLLEQGMLCMGPVTRAGCGGDEVRPRCIAARVPCRGCYGPVRQEGDQRLDMLNALASNGLDVRSLPEFESLLRFSGAHRLLRTTVKGQKESPQ
jgi:F420-non-reducing hydrogenase small subunit